MGAGARPPGQWPLLIVVAGMISGLAMAFAGDDRWRLGGLMIGVSVGIGAFERLVLSNRRAGLLQVRTKAFDVAVLALLAGAIIVLALAVPRGR